MVFPENPPVPGLSGDRFQVTYHVFADAEAVESIATGIALEQTVELPAKLVPDGAVRDQIVGQIEQIERSRDDRYSAVTLSYAVETAGTGTTQLLNVVFGNTSMLHGIQVARLELPDSLLKQYPGPQFGQTGLRQLLNVPERPLICTALKPMGLSPEALADLAYRLALGGLDLIKDDHGLANQPFCPYEERVERCAEAVARANRETGLHCLYLPNVTAPHDELMDRALFAKQVGAGGLMVSYGLNGFDSLRLLAEDDRLGLPVLAHPALSGSFVTSASNGIGHYVLYGQLMRLLGADASIFVSFGGRFAYSQAQCSAVVAGCTDSLGSFKPIFPVPGGGMTLERIPELREFYGRDVIFLVAGGLYGYGDDLTETARQFVSMAQQAV